MPNFITPAPNPANYQSDQNYQIDIDQIYADFIQEIDSVRSYVNASGKDVSDKLLGALSGTSSQAIINFLTPNPTFQESRCHAFFRLIGLPVAGAGTANGGADFFNPGFDIISPANLSPKLKIAGNLLNGFRDLSTAREQYPLTNLKIFSVNTGITASVLALTSGSSTSTQSVNIRTFSAPFNDDPSNPFLTNATSQSYPVGDLSIVGSNEVLFSQYLDVNNNSPSLSVLGNRQHIIRPLAVDPIIDFAVNPASRRVAVPFVPDKSFLKVDALNFAKRPLLEKVIRDRITATSDNQNLQPAQQSIINYINSIPAIHNQAIISRVTSNLYNLAEQTQFANFLNIIQAMMQQLVNSLITIHKAQSLYYWVPLVSAVSGIEGGASVQDVFLSTQQMNTNGLITNADKNILLKVIGAQVNQFNSQAAQAQGIPDVGGFAFDSVKSTFNSDTSSAFVDANQLSVDNLMATRQTILQKANDALRTVEIIMGEFSGFGLCDIIGIMGSLYLMPQNSLIGLLDDNAFARMKNALSSNINTSNISRSSYFQAMTDLSNSLQAFYQLMDSIYADLLNKNGLPT